MLTTGFSNNNFQFKSWYELASSWKESIKHARK